jgi:hypothetical protein
MGGVAVLRPAKPRRLDQPIAVSLEALVPLTNCYRHLEAMLDLGFVRDWKLELYAERGRPSIDPVVFFKLQLVMFFEGLRSERQLNETASLNLTHRYSLSYALDEALPGHSCLTRIASTPAPWVADPFALSVGQSTASWSLHWVTGPCSSTTDDRDRSAWQLTAAASNLIWIN